MKLNKTKKAHEQAANNVFDNIEIKGEANNYITINVRGRKIATIDASGKLDYIRAKGDNKDIKREAISLLLKKKDERELKALLGVLSVEELITTMLSYDDLDVARATLGWQFDHPEANKLDFAIVMRKMMRLGFGITLNKSDKEMSISVEIKPSLKQEKLEVAQHN